MRREHREGDEPGDPGAEADSERLHQLQRHRQVRAAKAIVLVLILTVLVLFIVWNAHSVPVNYVFFKANNDLIWVMLVCALLGGIVGFIVGRPGGTFRFRHDDEEKKG
ncbi:MAG: hypothetical protein ACJ77A_07360 [Actinomycetota bacterium]